MFESLGDRLSGIFSKLRGRGALSEDDVNAAMREIRVALLEADVALPVVKDFIAKIKERAIGQEVVKSITPDQLVVKVLGSLRTHSISIQLQKSKPPGASSDELAV